MRIALLGARNFPARHGGIERAVESLGAAYAARGHDVTVLVAEADDAPIEGGLRTQSVGAVRGKYLMALSQALSSVLHTSKRNVDVVHVHGVGPGIVIPLLKARGIPVVLTVHALDYNRDKWPPLARRVFRWLSGIGVRRADEVVCVSEHLRQEVESAFGVHATVVPNGVAISNNTSVSRTVSEFGLTEGRFLLFVGRLVPEKRVETLLHAYAELGSSMPLVIVGSGAGSFAEDYEAELREMAPAGVRFLGDQTHDIVCDLLSATAAFVNPSSLEGMPLTVLEARALGTPVVLSDIPSHRELAGESSRVFGVDDVPQLAEALHDALVYRVARRAAADLERADVAQTYAWGPVADRTLAVYRKALANRPKPLDGVEPVRELAHQP